MILCPKCESSLLHERERGDIVLDVCRECGGVWLDRGELERIMAQAAESGAQEKRMRHRSNRIVHDYDGEDFYPTYMEPPRGPDGVHLTKKQARKLAKNAYKAHKRHNRHKKKNGFAELIGDIFD